MSTYYRGEVQYRFGHDRVTWSVRAIILTNVAIFAADLIVGLAVTASFGVSGIQTMLDVIAFNQANFLSGLVWTPLTYMFFHTGLMHLFFNMLMLYFFGPDVERALGTRQFIYFYVICGAAGVMANFAPIVDPAHVIGASGAVLGVLVAFAILDPDRQVFLFPIPIPLNARALVIIVIVLNLMTSVGGGSGTSVATHLGGMAVGFLYMKGVPMFNQWRLQRRIPKGPSKKDMDKLGEEIDNILHFRNQDRR